MMRAAAASLLILVLAGSASAELRVRRGCSGQPQPKSYRNAWEDCGGMGASATERMRSIAASIKGFAVPEPFMAHAAQDAGSVDPAGMTPGVRELGMPVYPGQAITKAARDGLLTAEDALDKYGPKE